MARTVGIGHQDFSQLIHNGFFYIDKTSFIREWWESGFGRYDIMLEPKGPGLDAIIIEFKVFHSGREKALEDTVRTALEQIRERRYEASLRGKGIPAERIRKYGFGFKGKEVLIGE